MSTVLPESIGHRDDIDGLRAIAVVAVVMFHSRVVGVSGGFLGVDVFFVISGYLITRLILDDIRTGRFSLAYFYERRVRRIFPALFAVLLFSSAATHALFLPDDAKRYGTSLLSTAFFWSNVLFWRETDYFDQAATTMPLLHTWSLAVEEQFYILYPLFLFLIFRFFRQRYAVSIGASLLLSLALSIWGATAHPAATFYLAPTRAWELLIGALLAMKVVPDVRRSLTASLLALVGLVFMGCAFLTFSAVTPFPVLSALPALGAGLVIHSGAVTKSLVQRLLGTAPLVFVGLISYSLYLWHGALLVFVRYYIVRPMTSIETGLTIVASVIVAALSWRFVENPFRGRGGLGSRMSIFSGAVASSLALGAYGGVLVATNGLPGRFGDGPRRLLSSKEDTWQRRAGCMDRICGIGPPGAPERFVLWGDSHAAAIAPAMEQVALAHQWSGLVAARSACAPLLGLKRYDRMNDGCSAFNDLVLERIKARQVRNVFLHARWALYEEGTHYKQEDVTPALLTPSRRVADNPAAFEALLRTTLGILRDRQLNVVIIASVPEVGMSVPSVLARAAHYGSALNFAPRSDEFMARQARAFEVLRRVARDYTVQLAYPHEALCDTATCAIARNGHPLYSDEHHLSVQGAAYLKPMLTSLLSAVR